MKHSLYSFIFILLLFINIFFQSNRAQASNPALLVCTGPQAIPCLILVGGSTLLLSYHFNSSNSSVSIEFGSNDDMRAFTEQLESQSDEDDSDFTVEELIKAISLGYEESDNPAPLDAEPGSVMHLQMEVTDTWKELTETWEDIDIVTLTSSVMKLSECQERRTKFLKELPVGAKAPIGAIKHPHFPSNPVMIPAIENPPSYTIVNMECITLQ